MRGLIAALLALAPGAALAHAGGDHVHGFATGFLHPVGGLDHVLAMVAVGAWAGIAGGAARWALPVAFLAAMAAGAGLALAGFDRPTVEVGIVASIVVIAALTAAAARAPVGLCLPLVALFGLAHGAEMAPGGGALGYGAGFLLATALLHEIGLLAARLALRGAGAAAAVAGIALPFPG
jgi:urease accessory protein